MIAQTTPTGNTRTAVRYNRSSKTWQCVNGTVTNHGNRNEALLNALTHDYPQLGEIVMNLIRLHGNKITDRAIKAAQLITHNHVFEGGLVRSQTQANTYYQVKFSNLPASYTCDCPDTRLTDDHLGDVCKHVLAQHIAYLAGYTLTAAPIPFRGEPVVINGADIDDTGLPF